MTSWLLQSWLVMGEIFSWPLSGRDGEGLQMTSCEHPSLYGTIVCPTYSVGARLGSFEVVQEHFRMVFAHRLALLSVLSSSTALSQRDSRHMRQQQPCGSCGGSAVGAERHYRQPFAGG